jgi:hypothetical protein
MMPSDILGDTMDQIEPVVAAKFPDQRTRSKKMIAAVTPTHAKAFNNKPAMAKQSRIQQPK